jgi:diamine N-acetyltransferase
VAQISLRDVSHDNWRETLGLTVHPDQQRFIADYAPIAAIALAKAYIRPGGLVWAPFAIYADQHLVGFIELACDPASRQRYWVYHFFIDQAYQGKGYGKAALDVFVQTVQSRYPRCQQINLTIHPENSCAQHVYTSVGFRPTGVEQNGEPVYALQLVERSTSD